MAKFYSDAGRLAGRSLLAGRLQLGDAGPTGHCKNYAAWFVLSDSAASSCWNDRGMRLSPEAQSHIPRRSSSDTKGLPPLSHQFSP
jgi:hypothetical protein